MRSFRMQEWNWNGLTMGDVKVTETACGASAKERAGRGAP